MKTCMLVLLGLVAAGAASAGEITIDVNAVDVEGVRESIGTVSVTDTGYGALFTPSLKGLAPGLHGFHVHENPSCAPADKDGSAVAGLSAGGHFDPFGTGKHKGPYGDGHLGDLPALYVDDFGEAAHPVMAPRISVANLKGRSLMIHADGDNYSDHPKPLGGGGARVACGVVAD